MQSLIEILKLNDPKTGTSAKTGKPYDMQDAECLLLNDDGSVAHVGVLQIPRVLRDKVAVGRFSGSFALGVNFASRRIEAQLVNLTPVPPVRPASPAPSLAPAGGGGAKS